MHEESGYTIRLNALLDRWNAGEQAALDELISHAQERLQRMASRMLADKPHVRRWAQTDDVLQNSLIRLQRSLKEVKPESKRAFFGLAAQQVRRELCDMARSLYGPLGLGRHHKTEAVQMPTENEAQPRYELSALDTDSIDSLDMARFHESVERLAEEEREVFDLIFYQGLAQAEVAELLGVSDRTVKRRFRAAKLSLHGLVNSEQKKEKPASE